MIKSMQSKKRSSAISVALNSVSEAFSKDNLLISLEKVGLKMKIADSQTSFKKVFELAYQVYQDKGYSQNRQLKMEVLPIDAHSDTLIAFMENDNNEVVASLTLYFDGNLFLPADNIFYDELNLLRAEGVKFAEVSRFVIKQNYQHQKEILVGLFNTFYIHAFRVMNIDEFIIEVNPRHVDYYRKILGFTQFSEVKECPRVNNAPAVLLRGNSEKYLKVVDKGEFEKRMLYNSFMPKSKEKAVIETLQAKLPMSIVDQKYFGLI